MKTSYPISLLLCVFASFASSLPGQVLDREPKPMQMLLVPGQRLDLERLQVAAQRMAVAEHDLEQRATGGHAHANEVPSFDRLRDGRMQVTSTVAPAAPPSRPGDSPPA